MHRRVTSTQRSLRRPEPNSQSRRAALLRQRKPEGPAAGGVAGKSLWRVWRPSGYGGSRPGAQRVKIGR